jgi:hypothetical protein
MPPRRRRWSTRAKLLWGLNAALAAGAISFGGHKLLQRKQMQVETRPTQHVERREIRVPREPLHFTEIPRGNYCTMYARLAAEKLFGLKYKRGDAWEFARNNKSVWKGATNNVNDIKPLFRPGQVIGLFNPNSNYNSPSRAYTHTALYVGNSNEKNWIMQRIGTQDRLEPLENYLAEHPGWKIMEIIEPK